MKELHRFLSDFGTKGGPLCGCSFRLASHCLLTPDGRGAVDTFLPAAVRNLVAATPHPADLILSVVVIYPTGRVPRDIPDTLAGNMRLTRARYIRGGNPSVRPHILLTDAPSLLDFVRRNGVRCPGELSHCLRCVIVEDWDIPGNHPGGIVTRAVSAMLDWARCHYGCTVNIACSTRRLHPLTGRPVTRDTLLTADGLITPSTYLRIFDSPDTLPVTPLPPRSVPGCRAVARHNVVQTRLNTLKSRGLYGRGTDTAGCRSGPCKSAPTRIQSPVRVVPRPYSHAPPVPSSPPSKAKRAH